jgi:lipid-binding SYLF domain-containing protein
MGAPRNTVRLLGIMLLGVLLAISTIASADNDSKRAKVRKQSSEAIERLYAAVPSSRNVIANSAGYATFRKLGVKIGVVGGGGGRGLAKGKDGKETFMAYGEVSAGVGLGIKTFDLIFVFDDAQAMTSFINKGWEYTGEATAAAKHGDQGAARTEAHSVSPGVRVYQLTSTGLAAELTIKGTRYFKDPKLNQ